MKNRETPKGVLLVVAAVLVLVVGYFFAWRPRAAELSRADGERATMEQELTALQAANGVGETPTTVDPVDAALAAAVPVDPQLSNLLRQLSGIAEETGVQQKSLTPSTPITVTGVPGSSIAVTITASGPKTAAVEYLRRVGGLDRVFVVDKVTLNPAPATDATVDPTAPADSVDLEVSGRVFTTAITQTGSE